MDEPKVFDLSSWAERIEDKIDKMIEHTHPEHITVRQVWAAMIAFGGVAVAAIKIF